MQKTSIYIILISLAVFILSFAIPTMAKDTSTDRIIPVEIFYKAKSLKEINIESQAKILPGNKLISKEEKWKLKAGQNIFLLRQKTGQLTHHLPETVILKPVSNQTLCLSSSDISTRCYHGTIKASIIKNKIVLINNVSIKDYLHSTIGSELPPHWPAEAVKAQVIATHTYLLYTLSKNKLIKDTTQDQFYGGTAYENPDYISLIDQVKDIIIVDKNKNPIQALFHSTCAGATLNNEEVFGGKPVSYLRAASCKWDRESNFYKTSSFEISMSNLKKAFGSNSIQFIKNKKLELKAVEVNNRIVKPYQFWLMIGKTFGWGAVPGVKFKVKCTKQSCKLVSRGAGHAVGLCQWGARGMAKNGFKYQDILGYYYKNITLLSKSVGD